MSASLDQKQKFIELRANGESYDKISKKLNISKPTLIKWAKELETEIANFKVIAIDQLREQYKISLRHRIEMWSEQLKAVREELNSGGYKDVSAPKLIELLDHFTQKLDDENMPVRFQSEERQADILDEFKDIKRRDYWEA